MNDESPDRSELVEALRLPAAYPHAPAGVELIETHISNLFLAGDFVYKIKKPVNLGFCDFSTLDLRRQFTYRELELNRRFSSGVHIGVEEVRRADDGAITVGGGDEAGRVIEYALKMHRLPADRTLAALIDQERDRLSEEIDGLRERLDALKREASQSGRGSEAERAWRAQQAQALTAVREALTELHGD